jgi:hypothetical protein
MSVEGGSFGLGLGRAWMWMWLWSGIADRDQRQFWAIQACFCLPWSSKSKEDTYSTGYSETYIHHSSWSGLLVYWNLFVTTRTSPRRKKSIALQWLPNTCKGHHIDHPSLRQGWLLHTPKHWRSRSLPKVLTPKPFLQGSLPYFARYPKNPFLFTGLARTRS